MATIIELDSVSASWEQDSLPSGDDGVVSSPNPLVAQAITGEQPAAVPVEPAPAAAAEPVPVDVGSGAPVQPGASDPAADAPLEYAADANNVVKLPANVSIDNIRVSGSDLVLEQGDGTLITIKNAASNVPTFMIGDVEVPRIALLAALESSGVDVAFGADGSIAAAPGNTSPGSSGGNFEVPPGGIGDGFDLTDLLPPTALQFPRYEVRELFASFEEEDTVPTIEILSDAFVVDEEGLPARSGEPEGSGEAAAAGAMATPPRARPARSVSCPVTASGLWSSTAWMSRTADRSSANTVHWWSPAPLPQATAGSTRLPTTPPTTMSLTPRERRRACPRALR